MNSGRLLIGAVLALLAGTVWAGPAGRVLALVGDVYVERQGQEMRLAPGAAIESGDTLRVGDKGALQVRFSDESIVSLRANSVLKVEEFRFERNAETDRSVLELVRGGMRTITGLIGKTNRENYSVKHRAATIGIRGTFYTLVSCDQAFQCSNTDGSSAPEGVYGGVTDGRIAVRNDVGVFEFGQQEQFHLAARNVSPERLLIPPGFLGGDYEVVVRGRGTGPGLGQQQGRSVAETQVSNSPQGVGQSAIELVVLPASQSSQLADSQLLSGQQASQVPSATSGVAVVYAATNPANQAASTAAVQAGSTAIWDAQGMVSMACGPSCYLGRGAATVAEQGADAAVVAWGRWIGGPVVAGGGLNGQTYSANQGLSYIAGVPTSALPTTGTAVSYSLLGATRMTFGDGSGAGLGLGTVTAANATVNFVAQTVSLTSTASFAGGNVYQLSMPATALSGTGFASTGAVLAPTAGSINACAGGPCVGRVVGQFYGPGASHLGVGYDIRTTTGTPTSANGVIVLKR